MKELTIEKKQFIDDNFYEGLLDNELDREKFEALITPEELHYLVDNHNWDNSVKVLRWVAETRVCSEATAMQLFWFAQPQEFQIYKLDKKLEDDYRDDVFMLIKTVHQNYQNDFYKKTNIHFDPLIHLDNKSKIPSFMKKITNGEIPYVYLDEIEVDNWFGEYLENKITNCKTAIELYNIAYFVKEPDRAKLILKHYLCDKGIALMLFWRLNNYVNLWYEAETIMEEIIQKIEKNRYNEVIAYDPITDKCNKIKEPKAKWIISKSMKIKV